ncbi:MAG: isoprenylcysteine carboxylmethyltransferase family protein [Anaerolineae bacterium]|nr:MAG: isoprenylcysteine carboxylmethyltransferase family protein [Anaerolineae bacterium]
MYLLLLSVFLWGALHSLLASHTAKAIARRRFGPLSDRFYRLAYNLFAVITFLPVVALMTRLPDRLLYQLPVPWLYVALLGQALALITLLVGLLQTDLWSFLGLRQIGALENGRKESLTVRGLYRWVRHPLYTAGLVFIWLSPVMTRNTLVVFAALTVYILIGAYFEERKLLREFGAAYAEYRSRTPMLIPCPRPGRGRQS